MSTENTNQVTNRINPWPGLSSYKDPATITKVPFVFCGRDKEKNDLYNLVKNNIFVTLYGKSGLGKTSLLNAGVFPLLRENQYFPINIRLGVLPENKVIQEIIIEIIESNFRKKGGDIIELSAVIKEFDLLQPEASSSEYLWTYFACHKFVDSKGNELAIVLAFDQFEEILYSRPNDALLLLQQMIYMMNDNNHLPSFNDGGTIYNYDTNFRFILSIREDNLFMLEDVIDNNYLQAMKKNRYRLKEITIEGAKDVVKIPGKGCIDEIDEDVIVDRIVNEAQDDDGTISSLMISFLCNRLFALVQDGDGVITLKQVEENGSETLEKFCRQQLSLLPDDEFDLFTKHLITEDGRRKIIDISTFSKEVPSGMFLLDEKTRLLHTFKISTNKEKQVEIIHDKFSSIVLSIKEEIAERKKTEETLKLYEQERKRLQEEEEKQRTKRNLEYNHKKRATERNVLVHKGRRLIDNALDFGEFRSISDSSATNNADRILDIAKQWSRTVGDYLDDEKDSEFVNQQVFSDPMLNDSSCILNFKKGDKRIPTIDGLYGVELVYDGALISDIFFKGKKVFADGSTSYDEPVFILGGYSGIHIDYDEKHREIQRKYLDESKKPIKTQDGYSIVKIIKYDDYDNPIQIRYYDIQNGEMIPAKHNHGNYGFDSVYDKNGNEVERFFVDEDGRHIRIVTGVYGKRMVYDPYNFRLLSISNIDFKGDLMADKDGYITDKKGYDENGVPTLDLYYDDKNQPWKAPDGTYGSIDFIDYSNGIITSFNVDEKFNVDENETYIAKNDGVFKTVSKFNNKKQIIEIYTEDVNNRIIEAEDKDAIKLFEYDEQGRILTYKVFDKDRNPVYGYRYGYNKEGTHILYHILLNKRVVGKYEDFDVEGIEYDFDNNKSLPVLKKYINEFNQYKECNDGYYAVRTWENEKEQVVKQLFYDIEGTPMQNKSGVFGEKVEYIDEETTKRINLDADGNMMEDNNGVAFTIVTENSSGLYQINYNISGEPHADDDWVYVHQERENTNQGYIERLFVLNSSKEQIQIYRPHRADTEWGLVPCMFVETTFDDKGRPLSEFFKDSNGHFVGDTDGDSYTIWEYEDKDNIEILSLYTVGKELKLRLRTKRDKKGRDIELFYLDKDNNLAKLEREYSGELHEYDDEEKKETITFIDSKGEVCNNREGYAHRIFWYDKSGHIIAQKDVTADGIILGSIVFREFIVSEKRVCAYYIHREDGQGKVIINENGSVFDYIEEDTKGRPIIYLYLDEDKLPICDNDGDYGLSYDYNDKFGLTVTTFLDKNRQPHNNKRGYGIMHSFKNGEEQEIKRLYFTVEGAPISLPDLLECYGLSFEYPNEHNRIVGYLNEKGEITTNSHGYAYREECLNPETGIRRVFFYDKDRNNTQSLEDENKEYGYAIVEEDNWRRIISLGKDGTIANNACGYAIKYELYEDGKLRFYKYHNADDKPIADSVGDYGTEIQRSDDGSMVRLVSLNKSYERHINDQGFCFCDVITDIAGDQVRIYSDMEGNQVLPKLRFAKRVKNWLVPLKKKEKVMPIINCRQIGAISDCVLGNVEGEGQGEKYGLHDTYVLLQYDSWKFGDDTEELGKIIANTAKQSKHLVLLPVSLNGSLLQEVGGILEMDFPAGQIGMRFKNWEINSDTRDVIVEKLQEKENA